MLSNCLRPYQTVVFHFFFIDTKLVEDVQKAAKHSRDLKRTDRIHEQQEVLVVSLSNAITNPRTVVVESEITCSAHITVNWSQRSVDLAYEAGLEFLYLTIVYNDPTLLATDKFLYVIKRALTYIPQIWPHRNRTRICECTNQDENICKKKKADLNIKEVSKSKKAKLIEVSKDAESTD